LKPGNIRKYIWKLVPPVDDQHPGPVSLLGAGANLSSGIHTDFLRGSQKAPWRLKFLAQLNGWGEGFSLSMRNLKVMSLLQIFVISYISHDFHDQLFFCLGVMMHPYANLCMRFKWSRIDVYKRDWEAARILTMALWSKRRLVRSTKNLIQRRPNMI